MPNPDPLYEAIVKGDAKAARELVQQALQRRSDPVQVVQTSMIPAMDEVGRRFETNEYFVPELMLAARAMKSGMELIRPLLVESGREPAGRVVIGTVKGDLHDIGKNLVAAMLEGGGFEVTDLGVNVAPEKFIRAVQDHQANLVGMSALLTTTMMSMKSTIEAFQAAGLRKRVKFLVGGAPITRKFADEIGADAYGANAVEAVAIARQVLKK